jgi:hypothetical protein
VGVTPAMTGLSGLSGMVAGGDVVYIRDTNTSPNTVAENASNGTAVGITAFSNSESTPIVYSLDNDAGGKFAINSSTGVVTVAGALDAETASSHTIVVRATANDSSFVTRTYTILVTDVDESDVGAVTDIDPATNTVPENSAIGTVVGITASASDADVTATITYSLTDDASGRFAIHPTTGVVTVAGSIDRETASSYDITVRATSSDTSFSEATFTIAVTDVNEFAVGSVTDSNGSANEISEAASNGATVGITASASDADATNNTITYSLDDSAGGRFTINSSTGVVTVADASLIVYANNTSHNITVRATGSDGSASTATFTIAVLEQSFTPDDLSNLLQYALDGGDAYEASTLGGLPVLRSLEPYGTYRQPRQGRCYLFDGSNDYAPVAFGDIDNLTLCCWVKTTSTSDSWVLTQTSTAAGGYKGLTLVGSTGKIRISFSDGLTSAFNASTTTVNNGAWHHVALTYDAGTIRLYVNGSLEATATGLTDNQSWNLLTLGALVRNGNPTGTQFFSGRIRDVRTYNVAKDATAIANIYAGNDDTVGLLAQYPCNEESGTVGYDISGNGNHLTLTNITQSTFHATDTNVSVNRNNREGYRFANNLLQNSEQLNLSHWTANATTVGVNTVAGPFGGTTAETVTPTTGNSFHTISYPFTFAGSQPQTFSFYAKSNGYNIWLQIHATSGTTRYFDLTAGTSYNTTAFPLTFGAGISWGGSITSVGGGWYRCVVSGTPSDGSSSISLGVAPNDSTTTYAGNGTSGVHLWGAQLEKGTSVSDYTPTTTTTFDRTFIPKRLSDANAADGNALTVTGQSPYPANIEVPCITGNGTDVRVDFGSALIPASSNFSLSLKYYHESGGSPRRIINQRAGGGGNFFAIDGNLNSSVADVPGSILAIIDWANVVRFSIANALFVGEWHTISLERTGNSYTFSVLRLSNGTTASTTFSSSSSIEQTQTRVLGNPIGIYSADRVSDLRITTGGVTTHFPLQDGPGSSNTNRNLSYIKSDGTYGVVSNAIVNGTVATIWGNRCPNAEDWCVKYGGDIAANGAFLPGQISGSLASDGTAKTLAAGKFGNPYSRINFNPFTAAELNALGLETAYAVTTARQSVSPTDTKFRRTAADGDDRFFTTAAALTGTDKTQAEAYVS